MNLTIVAECWDPFLSQRYLLRAQLEGWQDPLPMLGDSFGEGNTIVSYIISQDAREGRSRVFIKGTA